MRLRVLTLGLALFATHAYADDIEARARALFAAGLAHAREGRWEDARDAFAESHELLPERPTTLFNLAGAQLRTGRLLHAYANYHRLSERHAAQLSSSHRRAIARQLARIERRMPRLRLQIEGLGPQDRVLLDRNRLYPDELERELWLDPGAHTLTVYRSDGSPLIRKFVLEQGQHQFVSIAAR